MDPCHLIMSLILKLIPYIMLRFPLRTVMYFALRACQYPFRLCTVQMNTVQYDPCGEPIIKDISH